MNIYPPDPQWVIFDLDNCLCNDAQRIPLIRWDATHPDERYHEYHAAALNDLPGTEALNEYGRWVVKHRARPIYLTARPLMYRSVTELWISRWLGINGQRGILIMRNPHDHRPSVDLKRSQLLALPEYRVDLRRIVAAYDDRQDIVDMYKEHGIPARRIAAHDLCAYTAPNRSEA